MEVQRLHVGFASSHFMCLILVFLLILRLEGRHGVDSYLQVKQPVLTFGVKDRCRLFEVGTLWGMFPTNTVSDDDADWSSFGMVNDEQPERTTTVSSRRSRDERPMFNVLF